MTAHNQEDAEKVFDRLAKVVQLHNPMKSLLVSLSQEELLALERLVARCERLQWYASQDEVRTTPLHEGRDRI